MEIFLVWIFFSVIVGMIASNKNRSGFGYFLLALVISPILAGILVLVLSNEKPDVLIANGEIATPDTHVRCPDCRELIRMDAKKCKHCGTGLVPQ